MKQAMGVVAVLAAGAGGAWAQEERGPRQEFERRMRDLEERFRAQKEQLEREFRDRTAPRREGDGVHAMLERILERLDRLERKLEAVRPPKLDFERLERRFDTLRPELERLVPRFRRFFSEDGDFDFEFRKPGDFREKLRKKVQEELEKRAEKPGDEGEEKAGKKERPRKPRSDGF